VADRRQVLVFVGVPLGVFALVFAATFASYRADSETSDARAASPSLPRDAAGTSAADASGRVVIQISAQTAEPLESYLARVAVDGSGLERITVRPGADTLAVDMAPVVSPDGRTIAFHRAVAGPNEATEPRLYLVDADGAGLRRLTDRAAAEINPSWSPDGRWIAFAVETGGGRFDLYRTAADGSRVWPLVETDGTHEDFPAWSPDGERLAFARYEPDVDTGSGDLWVANADGSGERLLLGGPDDDSAPSWSPDGRRIAFLRNGHVMVMNADGTEVRALTDPGQARESRPMWSSDGSRLVFTRDPGSLFVLAIGSRPARVPLDAPVFAATWEPAA
jgi:Tol biopolymer transport system component